jgi:ubiquinone/menaquinone biosynthesis C-methylase UbiE
MNNRFDHYAGRYRETVEASVRLVGGDTVHYARRKIDLLPRTLVPVQGTVLDFGCGVGVMTRLLAQRFPSARLIGTDPSPLSLTAAGAEADTTAQSPVTYVHQPGSEIPLPANSCDLAVAACVFHHIIPEDRLAWMTELHRVVKPGGAVCIFEHNPRNPLTRRAVADCPFDEGVKLLQPEEVCALATAGGFSSPAIRHYLFLPPLLYPGLGVERLLGWLPVGGQYLVTVRKPIGTATS